MEIIKKFFKFEERKTTFAKEILAGITTFLTMAYILFVNAGILSDAGMPFNGVFIATAIAAALATIAVGYYANLPLAMAPGMGLNAFFAYTLVLGMGIPWQQALAAVFISGIIYLLIVVLGLRKIVVNAIPSQLKYAIGVGIGFFIAFIGLVNAGIIVSNPATLVGLGDLTAPTTLLAIVGLIVTFAFVAFKLKGAVFFGIVVTAITGFIMGLNGIQNMPTFAPMQIGSGFEEIFGAAFTGLVDLFNNPNFFSIIFAFLFVDFFDTAGTLMAVTNQLGFLSDDEKENAIEKANLVDSSSTIVGSILGTSTVTSYIESSAGIGAGGRTGFTSIVTGVLFLLSLLFIPLASFVTGSVTAAAMVVVGIMMAGSLAEINWRDWPIATASFMTIIMMILTYSISDGIAFGFITYLVSMLAAGRFKDINFVMYILAALFVVHYVW